MEDPPLNPNIPCPWGAFPHNAELSGPNEGHRWGGWRGCAKLLIRALRNIVGRVGAGLVTAWTARVGDFKEGLKIYHAGLYFCSKPERDCLEHKVSLCSARGSSETPACWRESSSVGLLQKWSLSLFFLCQDFSLSAGRAELLLTTWALHRWKRVLQMRWDMQKANNSADGNDPVWVSVWAWNPFETLTLLLVLLRLSSSFSLPLSS